MADFPPNPENGELRFPYDILNEIYSTHNKPQVNCYPASFSANTDETHAIQVLVQPKVSVDRSLPDAAPKVFGVSGPCNPIGICSGGGLPTILHTPYTTWNSALHFQPIFPGLAMEIYNYPVHQAVPAPIDIYNYPIAMFTPSQNQGLGVGPEAMAGQQNFPSSPVKVNSNEVNGCVTKCSGTGVFLPNKEATCKNKQKDDGRDEILLNHQVVPSTSKTKKELPPCEGGKKPQGNQTNTSKEDTMVKDELQLPPGIILPEEWTY